MAPHDPRRQHVGPILVPVFGVSSPLRNSLSTVPSTMGSPPFTGRDMRMYLRPPVPDPFSPPTH